MEESWFDINQPPRAQRPHRPLFPESTKVGRDPALAGAETPEAVCDSSGTTTSTVTSGSNSSDGSNNDGNKSPLPNSSVSRQSHLRFSSATAKATVYVDVDRADLSTESVLLPAEHYRPTDQLYEYPVDPHHRCSPRLSAPYRSTSGSSFSSSGTITPPQSRPTPRLYYDSNINNDNINNNSTITTNIKNNISNSNSNRGTPLHRNSVPDASLYSQYQPNSSTTVATTSADVDLHTSLSSILRPRPARLVSAPVTVHSSATPKLHSPSNASRPPSSSSSFSSGSYPAAAYCDQPGQPVNHQHNNYYHNPHNHAHQAPHDTLFLVSEREVDRREQAYFYGMDSTVSVNSSSESLLSSESSDVESNVEGYDSKNASTDISSSSSAAHTPPHRRVSPPHNGPNNTTNTNNNTKKKKRRHGRHDRLKHTPSSFSPFVDLTTVSLAAAGLSLVAGLSFSAGYAFGRRSAGHLTVSG